jgi:hypothetical protein
LTLLDSNDRLHRARLGHQLLDLETASHAIIRLLTTLIRTQTSLVHIKLIMVSAFSIGTGKRSIHVINHVGSEQRPTNQFVPGPGSYNPIKKQKYEPPAYRLHIFPNRLLESEQETEATYWHRSHQVHS